MVACGQTRPERAPSSNNTKERQYVARSTECQADRARRGCGAGDGPWRRRRCGRRTLRVANSGEPDSLDPHQVSGNWEDRIVGDMFMGLTTEAADGTVIPGAAESWTISDDGLTYTFTLREHSWSDGDAGHRRRLRVRPAPDPRSRDRRRIRLSALPDQERRGDQQRQPRPIPRRSARARSIPRPSRSPSSGRPPTSSSC